MNVKRLFLVVGCILLAGTAWAAGGKEVAAGDVATIQFMGWEASPLETASVESGLSTFMARNPEIRVEYTPVAGDYSARLLTLMAGDAAPDVFFLGSGDYRRFASRGVLLNLTQQFEQSFDIRDFIPLAQQKMVIDGEIYGLSSTNVSPVLYYNMDIFDRAGLPYPPSNPNEAWTWDEFVQIAQELTLRSGNRVTQFGTFGFDAFSWGWVFPAVVSSAGGRVFNDDYTELLLNSPEGRDALRKMLELRTVYGVSPEGAFAEDVGMNASQMLQTGMVATMVNGSWALQELAQMGFRVGVGVLPIIRRPATVGQAHLHSAYANTAHPEEAWKLIEFLSSIEYQTDLVRAGLWIPNREDMYLPTEVGNWLNPDVHPAGFEELIPYFTNYGEAWPGMMVPADAWDIINEELDNFFFAGQPLDVVLPRMERRVNPILRGQ